MLTIGNQVETGSFDLAGIPLFTVCPATRESENCAVLVFGLRRALRALVRSWRPTESVLLMPLLEVESAVGELRSRHDPSAAVGVPPHITVVYPFLPPHRLHAAELRELAEVIAEHGPLSFDLVGVCGFPGVVYLAPEPAQPLVDLVKSVSARFPEAPPYGGAFPEIVPHLTVAMTGRAEAPATPHHELVSMVDAAAAQLPIRCVADEVWLMVRRVRWQLRARFQLGSADRRTDVPAWAGIEWT